LTRSSAAAAGQRLASCQQEVHKRVQLLVRERQGGHLDVGDHKVRLLLGETIRPVAIGIAAGLGASVAGARLVRTFAFQVQPLDPMRLAGIAGGLLVIAVVVSLRPALRAARIDVARTLRDL